MPDLFDDALSAIMPELKTALMKKLSGNDIERLGRWIAEERYAAAAAEWDKQKERVLGHKALIDAADSLLVDMIDRSEVRDEHTGTWFNDFRALADALTGINDKDYGQTDYSGATNEHVENFCEDSECVVEFEITDDGVAIVFEGKEDTLHFATAEAAMLAIDERQRK